MVGSKSGGRVRQWIELADRLDDEVTELREACERAKVLIGARNDTLSEAARQSNISEAWHILDTAIAKAKP